MLFWVGDPRVSAGIENQYFPGFFSAIWVMFIINIFNVSDFYIVIVPFVLMFVTGAFVATMEDRIAFQKNAWIAILLLILIADYSIFQKIYTWVVLHIPFLWGASVNSEQVYRVIYLISFPFFVIYMGKMRLPIPCLKNDYSYGVYIYGWPLAQVLIYLSMHWSIKLSPVLYFSLTMAVTLPVAYLSWVFVEKPSLSFKRK